MGNGNPICRESLKYALVTAVMLISQQESPPKAADTERQKYSKPDIA